MICAAKSRTAKTFENKEGGRGFNGVTNQTGLNQGMSGSQNERSKRYLSADSAREKRTPQFDIHFTTLVS